MSFFYTASNIIRQLDYQVKVFKVFGGKKKNATLGSLVAGSVLGHPALICTFAQANADNVGVLVQHLYTLGIGSSISGGFRVNLFEKDAHCISATGMYCRTLGESIFKFHRYNLGLDYNHSLGHSVSLGTTYAPQFDLFTIETSVKVNLWQSPNRATSVDLNGYATHHVNGPLAGKNNFGCTLGVTHRF